MGIYLDSADLAEINKAAVLPFICGVTTNPALISKALGAKDIKLKDFLSHIKKIKKIVNGDIFIQTNYSNSEKMIEEAEKIYEITGEQGVIKIPTTEEGLLAISALSKVGIRTAATAVFTGIQAYLAAECGAEFVIPYYSRVEVNMRDGLELVEEILEILASCSSFSSLLVASVKSRLDVQKLLCAGVDSITIPLELIEELVKSPYTDDAVKKFNDAMRIK